MKINLFSQEIELVKVEDNANKLNTSACGYACFLENKAYFDGYDPFWTCLHEIMHFYINRVGLNQVGNYNEEVLCDISSRFITQLMLENGEDILQKIKQFACK